MTFDANGAGPGIDGIRGEMLTPDQFRDAAPSLAVSVGDGAA